jgi:hypothetical protein
VGVSVLISADAEWRIVRAGFPGVRFDESPLGEWFVAEIDTGGKRDTIHFFHGGYGRFAGDWESGAIAYVAARNRVR